jgi:hypothetical protein
MSSLNIIFRAPFTSFTCLSLLSALTFASYSVYFIFTRFMPVILKHYIGIKSWYLLLLHPYTLRRCLSLHPLTLFSYHSLDQRASFHSPLLATFLFLCFSLTTDASSWSTIIGFDLGQVTDIDIYSNLYMTSQHVIPFPGLSLSIPPQANPVIAAARIHQSLASDSIFCDQHYSFLRLSALDHTLLLVLVFLSSLVFSCPACISCSASSFIPRTRVQYEVLPDFLTKFTSIKDHLQSRPGQFSDTERSRETDELIRHLSLFSVETYSVHI